MRGHLVESVTRRGQRYLLTRGKCGSLSVRRDVHSINMGGKGFRPPSATSNLLSYIHGVSDFSRDHSAQCDVLLAQKETKEAVVQLSSQEQGNHATAYSFSFANTKPNLDNESDEQSAQRLAQSLTRSNGPSREGDSYDSPLPHTLSAALEEPTRQARVITKAVPPFEIVSVNSAWEDLCGYTKEESVGKTLAILQGPETDKVVATSLISHMLQGESAGAVLVNYKLDGTKFYNRLRVCPLTANESDTAITHLLGVLMEVKKPGSKIEVNA